MPTDRQQTCKKPGCSNRFTRVQGTNRVFCFKCRPERTSATVTSLPSAQNGQSHDQDGEDQDQGPTLVDFTKEALEQAGVLESWQGAAAMELAKLIVAGKHGASGAAGTIKAHREAMSVALADSGEEADIITMIFARDA